jgi:prephenate dehydrogenase
MKTAVFDVNPHQLRFVYNTYRFTTLEEIKDFERNWLLMPLQ